MTPQPRRLFIGLIPDRDVQARIQRHCRDWQWPEGARPTRFGRYHLTLHFLGDQVRLAHEQALRKALARVPMQPFELLLQTPRCWQHGLCVLQPQEHAALRRLREDIAAVLPAAGLRSPKAFEPHVTLARDAFGAQPPRAAPEIVWPVTEFLLVWSRLPPEVKPARHEVLQRFAANGRAAPPARHSGEQITLFE